MPRSMKRAISSRTCWMMVILPVEIEARLEQAIDAMSILVAIAYLPVDDTSGLDEPANISSVSKISETQVFAP